MEKDKINVLLIDDEEAFFILTSRFLRNINHIEYNIDWVYTFTDATEKLLSDKYDVFIVDYKLKDDYDGIDLMKKAIEVGSKTPFILLTGQGGYEIDKKALNAGFNDYLSKEEIDSDVLDRSIRYAIKNKKLQNELENHKNNLEIIVENRTKELEIINQKLKEEINQHKQTEIALKESEEQLKILINSIPDLIYFKDKENKLVHVNKYFLDFFNLENLNYKGMTFSDLINKAPFYEGIFKTLEKTDDEIKNITFTENLIPHIDSILKTFYFIRVPLYSQNNKTGLVAIGIDITERKKMELELLKQNSSYISYEIKNNIKIR